jgi:flagellar biosynthetic protein FliP
MISPEISVLAAAEPGVQLLVNGAGGSSAVRLMLLLTALSFASAALVSVTSFTRMIIVLSFLRQALGSPQVPPNQVLLGLSLALSGFVMAPTATRVYNEALSPYLDEKISHTEALARGSDPLREFMLRHTRQEDLRVFYEISGQTRPQREDVVPMTVLIPAFMISELTTAFKMGLFVFIPLMLVDLLVSALLMSLGMMMVPPTIIALPLKVGVFIMADGWRLVVSALVRSF